MKKLFCTALCIALVAATTALFANDDAEARRQAFINGFDQLTKNTQEGLVKPIAKETLAKGGATWQSHRLSFSDDYGLRNY